jgi:polyribonucleotide 5'-hydroxyl-kinase
MLSYVNVHAALDQRRTTALAAGSIGPRAMIVGPANVGKSTLVSGGRLRC